MNSMRRKILIAVIAVGFAMSFLAGLSVGQTFPAKEGIVSDLSLSRPLGQEKVDFSLIEKAWETLHQKYVDTSAINDQELVYGAIKGMLQPLDDPYTVFFKPEEKKKFLDSVNGTFEGIGAEIGIRNERLTVIAPLKDTPAEKSGLRAGDKILEIDGTSTEDMLLEEAVQRIRGPKNSEVVLLVSRKSVPDPFSVSIIRGVIEIPSLRWEMRDGDIAYISFYHFSRHAGEDFSSAAQAILKEDARGLILDLRNNPGGYLSTAVDVAGWLLPQGKLVVREEFADRPPRDHPSKGPSSLADIPAVVLINEGSASASEILAGALRDHRDITLVGAKTFGKGSVQEFEELSGGTGLKLTVARWLTPSGHSIEEEGLKPDVVVELEDGTEEDEQLQKALELARQGEIK